MHALVVYLDEKQKRYYRYVSTNDIRLRYKNEDFVFEHWKKGMGSAVKYNVFWSRDKLGHFS